MSCHEDRSPEDRRIAWLLVLAAEALYVGVVALGDARSRLPKYWLLVSAAGLLSLLAPRILSGRGTAFLVFSAALFRATLLFRNPDLSDDIQRYLWDARVSAAGVSPWSHAPADPSLARIAPERLAGLPHREVRTVYPPVAEAVFHSASLGGTRAGALRAAVSGADVAVVWLLASGGAPSAAALYAFHPLPVLEIAGQGHVDAVGIALLLAALAFLGARRETAAGLAFALSVLTKYVPLAATLPMLRRGGRQFALASGALGLAIWIAAARPGASPAGGLTDYATRWEFNSVLYPAAAKAVRAIDLPERAKALFEIWKARQGHPPWAQAAYPYFYDGFFARALLGLVLLAVLVVVARRIREPRLGVFASLGALTLASPTLHPWYLLWTLPFAAERREPAFLYLSFAAPLAYGLLYPVRGVSPAVLLCLEYVPFAALLARTLARRRALAGSPAPLRTAPA